MVKNHRVFPFMFTSKGVHFKLFFYTRSFQTCLFLDSTTILSYCSVVISGLTWLTSSYLSWRSMGQATIMLSYDVIHLWFDLLCLVELSRCRQVLVDLIKIPTNDSCYWFFLNNLHQHTACALVNWKFIFMIVLHNFN